MNERERVAFILSVYGLSPSQFADKTGIPRASVSHILSGRNRPSLDVLQKVAAVFPSVDLNWLVLGVGNAPTADPSDMASVPEKALPQDGGESLFPNEYDVLADEYKEPKTDVVPRAVKTQRDDNARAVKTAQTKNNNAERSAKKSYSQRYATDTSKYIKEIRVFYSDGTYEILYPEK